MTLTIQIGAQEGALIAFEKNVYSLRMPSAFAPGQPLELRVLARQGQDQEEEQKESEFTIEARTIGSKLEEDGLYLVRARAINLRREHREALAKALTRAS